MELDSFDSIINMDSLFEQVETRTRIIESARQVKAHNATKSGKNRAKKTQQIWTEKYRPKSFLQLCPAGNERQYRAIMHWLKKWSPVVFGEASFYEQDQVDHKGRPLRKLLLVHGPPGVGKTTAVHVLARQMGYAVQELNAANSMDSIAGAEAVEGAGRFANATAALKLRVQNAMTSNSITAGGRPTCLVVDEIDTLLNSGDIVKVLGDLVQADLKKEAGARDVVMKPGRKADRKKHFSLNRPIICIANDIFSNNRGGGPNPMDKLRPLCDIVNLRRPATGKTPGEKVNMGAQRSVKEFLATVSQQENLGLDSQQIGEVFELCEGDMRACLNHMQFASRALDPYTTGFLGLSLGTLASSKDVLMSWLALVDLLFRRDSRLSKDENFDNMIDLLLSGDGKAAAAGSLDKVIRGCFNRYLDVVHLQDNSPARVSEISDWLHYYDTMMTWNRDAASYPTLASLKFWSLFSEHGSRRIKDEDSILPNSRSMEFESLDLLRQNRSMVKVLMELLPISLRVVMPSDEFVMTSFVPFLDKMLSPRIGTLKNKLSLSPFEKGVIDKLAVLTRSIGIGLESHRDLETNQITLSFRPDWDSLTVYESSYSDVPFASRQKEIYMKRAWLFPLLQLAQPVQQPKREAAKSTVNEPKTKRHKIAQSVDFFKKYGELPTQSEAPQHEHEETRIWVKYHEGFSNAVRKNIGWEDLWAP